MNSARGSARGDKQHYISDLRSLFQAQGTSLYEGLHCLCLTNVCLYHLLKKFTILQDESVNSQHSELQHLLDCLSKVQSLKLISDRKATIAPSLMTLDISLFRSLQSLSLKRVPISSLSGLRQLREQLCTLSVERCGVSNIEDLIVGCGRDEARPGVWNNLRVLDLGSNSVQTLGEALQFLPALDRINLSSNQIGSGRLDMSISNSDHELCIAATNGIKLIDSVSWLNLGFNQLTRVPQFGEKAIYNLTVLILRNNLLRDIKGVEVLGVLIELDLGENLISLYSKLNPLLSLHKLEQLTLAGNPVSFDPKYRVKVVQCLSYLTPTTTFQLDGKKLSSSEKKIIPCTLTHYGNPSSRSTLPPPLPTSSLLIPNGLSVPALTEMPSHSFKEMPRNSEIKEEEDGNVLLPKSLPSLSTSPSKKTPRPQGQAHKSSKPPRLVSLEEDKGQATAIPFRYRDKIMKDQDMRSQLSSIWLTTTNAANDNSLQSLSASSTKSEGSTEPVTDTGIPPESHPQTLHLPPAMPGTGNPEAFARKNGGYSIIKTHSEASSAGQDQKTIEHRTNSITETCPHTKPESQTRSIPVDLSVSRSSNSSPVGHQASLSDQLPHSLGAIPTFSDPVVSYPVKKKQNSRKTNTERKQRKERMKKLDELMEAKEEGEIDEELNVGKKEESPDTVSNREVFEMEGLEEKAPEKPKPSSIMLAGEMYHVSLYDSASEDDAGCTDTDVLMTLSDRLIQEITLSGHVQDQLDLQCLKSAQIKKKKLKGKECDVLVLHFTYERRDRRKREYLLTDINDKVELMNKLEPIVEQNKVSVSIATKLECLKCQVVIDWSEALDDPQDSPKPLTPQSHHSFDPTSWSAQDKVCPFCKEKFLIQTGGSEPPSVGSQRRSFSLSDSQDTSKETMNNQSLGFDLNSDITTERPQSNNSVLSAPSQQLLSPGHMNVGLFNTYPEAWEDSTTARYQPSPLPDMAPFNLLPSGKKPAKKESSLSEVQHLEDGQSKQMSLNEMGVPHYPHGNRRDNQSMQDMPIVPEDDYVGFGRNPSTSFPGNPSHWSSQSPLDEGYSSRKPSKNSFDTHDGLDNGNVLSDDPLYNRNEREPQSSQRTISSSENPTSKSLSWSYLQQEHKSTEQEADHPREDTPNSDIVEGKVRGIPVKSKPKEIPAQHHSPTLMHTPVSASVPSEGGLMSYFRWKSKEKGESPKSGHKHSRTKSQDLHKVPPLPDNLLHGPRYKCPESPNLVRTPSQTSVSSTDRGPRSSDRNSSGEEKKMSNGSGSGRFGRFSARMPRLIGKKNKSSSDTEEGRPELPSNTVLYKSNDPTFLHSNIILHLDMNVFTCEKEKFQLALRSPMIQYGDWNEIEAFLIVSNCKAYLYRVVGPESLEPEKWLEERCQLKLNECVYIEIGVAYQSLRLEFNNPPRCYTFLIGIEESCRKVFDKLSYLFSDVSRSAFKSVRVAQFSLKNLTDPHQVLKEQITEYYENLAAIKKPSFQRDASDDGEQLQVYVLAHKYNSGRDPVKVLVTVVLTDRHLYIGRENPQWPFPAIHPLPDKDDLLPPYSGVIKRDITDVEQLILYDDQQLQFTLKFFSEGPSETNDTSWTIILKCSKSMRKLVECLKQSWAEKFQQELPTVNK